MYKLYCTAAPSYAQAYNRLRILQLAAETTSLLLLKNKMKPSPLFYDKEQTQMQCNSQAAVLTAVAGGGNKNYHLPSTHLKEREAFQAFGGSGSSQHEAPLQSFKHEEPAAAPPWGGVR